MNFKDSMMKTKGYYGTYEDLDAMFDYAKTNADNRIYTEVKAKIHDIKSRHVYN